MRGRYSASRFESKFLFLKIFVAILVIVPAFFLLRLHFVPDPLASEEPLFILPETVMPIIQEEIFDESLHLENLLLESPPLESPPLESPPIEPLPAALVLPLDFTDDFFTCPIEAYYAGQIERAVLLLSGSLELEEKRQLVTLYWELGENARAANLLEELLVDPRLTLADWDELKTHLFFTRVLMGSYEQAAGLRSAMEPVHQRMSDHERAEFYFYNAWVFHQMGDLASAVEFYRRSLDIYTWRSLAWYRLGTIILDTDPEGAEEAFRSAWNQDRALTAVINPLARLLASRDEWMQARNLWITANERLPYDAEISASLALALRLIGPPGDGLQFVRREITAIPPRVTPAPFTPGEGIMRIGLAVDRPLLSVKAGGDFTIRNAETGQILFSGVGGQQFWVECNRHGALIVYDANNRILLYSAVPILYELYSNEDTSIVSGVVTWAMSINRTYRGALEFRPGPDGITAVSIVNMGDYLYGVVPAEIPAHWPAEALYAQAIISRSYAIAYRGTFADLGFDIWNTARSQTYMGVGIEHERTSAAVDATRGIILVGETSEPLAAYYSANHGGHSEDSLVMWGYNAYMQAVQDRLLPPRNSPLPPDALFRWIRDVPATYSNVPWLYFPNTYRWERWVRPEEIRRRLIDDIRVGQDPGEIKRIVSRGRGISGRITELEVKGSEGSVYVIGNVIWNTMGGLRSSLFTIRHKFAPDGELQYLVFQGAGYGHGIGLDQHAAAAKAARGMSASEILHHFYPRASVMQLDPSSHIALVPSF